MASLHHHCCYKLLRELTPLVFYVLNQHLPKFAKLFKQVLLNFSLENSIFPQALVGPHMEEALNTEIPENRIFSSSCWEFFPLPRQLKVQNQMAKEVFRSRARAERTSLAYDGHIWLLLSPHSALSSVEQTSLLASWVIADSLCLNTVKTTQISGNGFLWVSTIEKRFFFF